MPRDERGRFVKAEDAAGLDRVTKAAGEAGEAIAGVEKGAKKAASALSLVDKSMSSLKQVTGLVDLTNIKGAEKAAGTLSGKIGQATKGVKELAGEAVGKLDAWLGSLGPKGQLAAAAIVMLTVALSALAIGIVAAAGAAITFSQEKDALIATFAALAGGTAVAHQLADTIDEMSVKLPFAGDQLAGWAKSLLGAGVSADILEGRITAIASATALMGEAGGAAAERMIKQLAEGGDAATTMIKAVQAGGPKAAKLLAEMGLQSADLAKALGVAPDALKTMALTADQLSDALERALVEKGAGALGAMSLTWSSITDKLRDSIGDLFEDLGPAVQPFMAEVKALFAEFFVGSNTAMLAKGVLTNVLTTVFGVAARVTRGIHVAFLTVQIMALKAAIAVAPVINVLRAVLSNATVLRGIIIGLAIPFVVLGAAIFLAFLPLIALVAVIVAAAIAIGLLISAIGTAIGVLIDWGASAVSAAGSFISGLVDGIKSGAGAVVEAMKGLASSAVASFKSTLGIKSPSKVMMQMGGYTTEGLAMGLDAGSPRVESAAKSLGGETAAGVESGARGGRAVGGSGGALQVTFAPGAIVINGAGKGAEEITEEMLATVLERIAGQMGLLRAT